MSTPSSAAGALAVPGAAAEGRGGSEEGEGRVGAGGGRLRAQLSVDYYNRTLSDWEPVIEPWRCACLVIDLSFTDHIWISCLRTT